MLQSSTSNGGDAGSPSQAMNAYDWATLVDSIRAKECFVFLGAGASTVPDGEVGLPTGAELSRRLAEKCAYPGPDISDFLRVCQFYDLTRGGHQLRRQIVEELSMPGLRPGRLHAQIAELPFQYVLTTNYDRLMETALEAAGKSPQIAVYDIFEENVPGAASKPQVNEQTPLVYKLHGSIDRVDTMLCTEDDIIEFLAGILRGDRPILPSVRTLFRNHSILFVGYGLKDWNIRTMIRAFRGKRPAGWVRSFAIQQRFDNSADAVADWEQSVLYWDKKESVHCIDIDAIEFFNELLRRFHERT